MPLAMNPEPPEGPKDASAPAASSSSGAASGTSRTIAAATPAQESSKDSTLDDICAVSLRLLAGAVPKRTLEALKRTVLSSSEEYPWQAVNKVVLGDPVDPSELAQRGLRAQRDWILRGGRSDPGPSLSVRSKTIVAKLLVQTVLLTIYLIIATAILIGLKHKWPDFDIYRVLSWLYETFPRMAPK